MHSYKGTLKNGKTTLRLYSLHGEELFRFVTQQINWCVDLTNTTQQLKLLCVLAFQCDQSGVCVAFGFLWERGVQAFCSWECRGQWKDEKENKNHFSTLVTSVTEVKEICPPVFHQ